jgi:hypothetical protein
MNASPFPELRPAKRGPDPETLSPEDLDRLIRESQERLARVSRLLENR